MNTTNNTVALAPAAPKYTITILVGERATRYHVEDFFGDVVAHGSAGTEEGAREAALFYVRRKGGIVLGTIKA